ncbi:ComEA family DNA-binding protein [Calycomorphotria hydatis]|uniref:Helix-hairpin-helix motif protein n=1 Tax=Calycomorphotria hydatis TaxID=2528027 RepID=A0A517T841_9PLAN|nr:helix-hairpin-helix domain-containing protein [Calycomorphotria hydatis]QDT64544.1 Helix-hairpin-helix motif protein [Calycomorphotria hydatis]
MSADPLQNFPDRIPFNAGKPPEQSDPASNKSQPVEELSIEQGASPPNTIPVSDEVVAQNQSPVRSLLGLIDHDIRILAAVCAIAALVMVGQYALLMFQGREPIDIERAVPIDIEYRIDVNAAHWMELAQLKGIGEILARRIVEYREAHGPFNNVAELQNVKGIGPAKLAALKPHIRIVEKDAQSSGE